MIELKADSPVYGGYVIAREEGVVFIKGAISGEVVLVDFTEKKKDYSIARVKDVIEPSEFRVEPPCRYFGSCGGCQMQFISYGKQVSFKEEIMLDCLKRIGGIAIDLLPSLSGADFNYRRRAQFKVSKDGRVGFYREDSRDVVAIDECLLAVHEINRALKAMRGCGLSGVKEVHVTSGDGVTALIKGRGFDEVISKEFINAGFSGVAFDDGSRLGGNGFVSLDLIKGMTYTVSPWTFFQSNWDMNLKAIDLLLEGLGPLSGQKVIDFYAGAGNFSLPIAREAQEVIAVEENPAAVKDGERNIRLNNIGNMRFLKGRADEKAGLKADIAVLDPPRHGLTDRVLNLLLEIAPKKIAYISCNPATLARDLKKLSAKYDVSSIRVMDFFPQTYHIESLTFLILKG